MTAFYSYAEAAQYGPTYVLHIVSMERAELAQRSRRYRRNGGIELRIYKHNATCVSTCVMTLKHLSRTPNTRDGVCICQDAILHPRGWRNVDPVYRVGGGGCLPEALNFFVTLLIKIIQMVCNTTTTPLELVLVSCTHIQSVIFNKISKSDGRTQIVLL